MATGRLSDLMRYFLEKVKRALGKTFECQAGGTAHHVTTRRQGNLLKRPYASKVLVLDDVVQGLRERFSYTPRYSSVDTH